MHSHCVGAAEEGGPLVVTALVGDVRVDNSAVNKKQICFRKLHMIGKIQHQL